MTNRLSDIEIFVAIVDGGGIAVAARTLGLSAAAVSRHLAALEKRLGVRLAERNSRRFRTTQEGALFYERCSVALTQIRDAEAEVLAVEGAARGLLRIGAPVDFGHGRIHDLVSSFADQHPGLRIHTVFSDAGLEVADDAIDVALRVGLPRASSSISRKITATRRVVCASPQYFKQNGMPVRPQDLVDHQCLLLARRDHLFDEWRFAGDEIVKVQGRLSSGSGIALVKWALAGRGLSLEALWDVEDHLRAGRLVECLSESCTQQLDLYVIFKSGLLPTRVRLFVDFMVAAFKRESPT